MPTDEVTQEDQAALRRYMIERARLAFDGTTSPHADLLLATLTAHRTASEQRGYDRAIAEVVARMKRIEPDEEAAGCPASWGDFLQILESVAIEAGENLGAICNKCGKWKP